MKHYGIGEWVDFARGLSPEVESEVMRDHLLAGCSECQELAEFCDGLSTICRDMAEGTVPEWVVRNALAIFPARKPKAPKRAFRLPLELIYDSFLAPAPAGLRAAWFRGWQALYRSGDCSLDLRVEPEIHSLRAAVIGQISNHALPKSCMGGLPVYVKQGHLVVAETRSNEFGEFQMEYEQRGRLQLCVDLENGSKRLLIPLRKLIADSVAVMDRVELSDPAEEPGLRSD
jgi:hypothetical protein